MTPLREIARSLGRSPGFVVAVVALLGVGLGMNAAMFGVVDRLLFRPPEGVRAPDELVRVQVRERFAWRAEPVTQTSFSFPDVEAIAHDVPQLAGVAAYANDPKSLGRGAGAREVTTALVGDGYFATLGVRAAIGRLFTAEEQRPTAAAQVAVLSDRFWASEFGRDHGVLGRTLELDGRTYTVIGIAPRGFTGLELEPADLFLPLATRGVEQADYLTERGWSWLNVRARLAPGATREAAAAAITTVFRRGEARRATELASTAQLGSIMPGRDESRSRDGRVALWMSALAGVVLVVACANVANLFLARTMRRRRELAVRLALGAGRARLAGALLGESLALAVAGGLVGLVVAQWAGTLLARLLLEGAPAPGLLDPRTLAVTLGAAVLTGLLAAAVPAWRASRAVPAMALRGDVRAGGGPRSRARTVLLVTQMALSSALLVGTGLFVRSLDAARRTDVGFSPERALLVQITTPAVPDADARRRQTYEDALARIGALPEVEAVGAVGAVPMLYSYSMSLRIPGRDSLPTLGSGGPYFYAVTPGFVPALGLRLVKGRAIQDGDRKGAQKVALINETMARTYWPATDAIGQCMIMGRDSSCTTIVGIVEDARRQELVEEPNALYYVPLDQRGDGANGIVVRTRRDERAAIPAVRAAVQAVAPDLPFVRIRPMQELFDPELRAWRLGAMVCTALGGLALLVAAFGLYSVLAYLVAERTREFGIRMALGAGAERVRREVLADGLRPAGIGVALGAGAGLLAAPAVGPLLFKVSPRDPASFAVAAGTLLVAAAVAAWLPAARATRVDPMVALRDE